MSKKIYKVLIILVVAAAIFFRIYLAKVHPTTIVSSSSNYGVNFDAQKAFDNDENTRWHPGSGKALKGEWLQVYYSKAKIVNRLAFRGFGAYSPKEFKLLASDDEKIWKVIYEGENPTADSNWKNFDISNKDFFHYYRFEIVSGYNDTALSIYEIKIANNFSLFYNGLLELKKALLDIKNGIKAKIN
jgi:hypothetical protein